MEIPFYFWARWFRGARFQIARVAVQSVRNTSASSRSGIGSIYCMHVSIELGYEGFYGTATSSAIILTQANLCGQLEVRLSPPEFFLLSHRQTVQADSGPRRVTTCPCLEFTRSQRRARRQA
jgi:hypothetical protein